MNTNHLEINMVVKQTLTTTHNNNTYRIAQFGVVLSRYYLDLEIPVVEYKTRRDQAELLLISMCSLICQKYENNS